MDYSYIAYLVEINKKEEHVFIVFNETMDHKSINSHLYALFGLNRIDIIEMSAGKIHWNKDSESFETFGYSDSLDLGSNKRDGEIFAKILQDQKTIYYNENPRNPSECFLISRLFQNFSSLQINLDLRYSQWSCVSAQWPKFATRSGFKIPSDINHIEAMINTQSALKTEVEENRA